MCFAASGRAQALADFGQEDVSLVDGAPLKILQRFDADQTWELEHGDMLYLPPKYAHYGVALEPGMTYSIGFRAPTRQEMVTQFLVYLQDRLCCDGMYADPIWRRLPSPAASVRTWSSKSAPCCRPFSGTATR